MWQGKAGESSSGADRCGHVSHGMAGVVRHVMSCCELSWRGRQGNASSCLVRSGKVWLARFGWVRVVWRGLARQSRYVAVRSGDQRNG